MTDFDKACYLAGWVENHMRLTVIITAEEILDKLSRPGELDCYYRIAKEIYPCKPNFTA